ncbi:hypothetical protein E2C01_095399 [Portunus trituberculatus]|uniref:Uncharacterized protein n=1 Tax=Portunus trituberculatus TaxID=210409 RepID=A0A5B7JV57_PORTR|nr:hypothetical protein [Portunus trituberculatus]
MLTNIGVAFQFMDKDMMKKKYHKHDMSKAGICSSDVIVLELKDLTYEERVNEMGLPTLQDRREQGDLITMYEIVNGIEKIDKKDLVLVTEEARKTKGHVKIRIRQCVKDIGKKVFHIEWWKSGMQ